MSVIYTRSYVTTCLGALLDFINQDVIITPTLEQIINDGTINLQFVFASALSPIEENQFNSILATFICPASTEQSTYSSVINDTTTGSNVLWSSDKITYELQHNIDHNNLLNIGTNTHAQIDAHIASTALHPTVLNNLSDVSITSPSTGNVLIYNTGTGQWTNQILTTAGSYRLVQMYMGIIPAASGTTTIPTGLSTPTPSQGTQIWSYTITPRTLTSKCMITTTISFAVTSASAEIVIALFRNNVCIGTMSDSAANNNKLQTVSFAVIDNPNTVGSVTYSARIGRGSGTATWYVNNTNAGLLFGGTLQNNGYKIEEYVLS